MIKKKYKVLDLFCGPGGFSTGFEAAGFEIIDAFDKDKWAVETFSENHRVKAKVTDLKTFDMALMPDADIIIGGPPCTQFSSAKSNKTRNVLDGLLLVQSFLRCVYLKNPKFWIMENVPTIQKYLPSKIPLKWIGIEEEGDLEIPQKVELIAADYGVPQRRKRYLIGNFPLPKQTHINPRSPSLFQDNSLPSWKTMAEALTGLPTPYLPLNNGTYEDPNYIFSIPFTDLTDHFYDPSFAPSEARSIERAKTNHPYMGLLAWPDKLEEPARTVVATQLGRETLVLHDKKGTNCEFRRATVRECAAIQSFPSTYQFFGSSYNIKYRLVGDAVPPLMAFAIAKEIANSFGEIVRKPRVRKTVSTKGNCLGTRIEPKRKKISTARKVTIMLPKKEVRGARVEFYNDGYSENIGTYNNLSFGLPIWKCRLVLGEGANVTKKFCLSHNSSRFICGVICDDPRIEKKVSDLIGNMKEVFASLPTNSEFYGRHCYNIEEGSVYGIADEIAELVESEFPTSKFHGTFVDLSEGFDHAKSKKIRIRLALGAIIGVSLAQHLNEKP